MPKAELVATESRRENKAHICGSNAGRLYSEDVRQCEYENHLQEAKGHTSAAARSKKICSNLWDELRQIKEKD